jgi:plastocyanin
VRILQPLRLVAPTFALACVAGAAGCRSAESIIGLAHVISDDGNDKGNPAGTNPGTQTLAIYVFPSASLRVGDTAQLAAYYPGGPTTPGVGWVAWGSADSSIVAFAPCNNNVCAVASSVGETTMSGVYYGSTAAVGVSVLPSAAGASALLNVSGTPSAWTPGTVKIQAGTSAQFNVGATHNVIFASAAGAPPNIETGGAGSVRQFLVSGTFSYQCTVHGETGVVIVIP